MTNITITIEPTDTSQSLSKQFSKEDILSVFRNSKWYFDEPPLDINYVLEDLFPKFFDEEIHESFLVKISENEGTELLIFEVKDWSIAYKSGLILGESKSIEKTKAEMFEYQNETPYFYILLARKLFNENIGQFSPYELIPFIQQQLYHNEIDEAGGYNIETSEFFEKPFLLDELEGGYEGTIYEWIHLFLKENSLYSLFLSETQVQQANEVSEGIYGPDSDTDENFQIIEDIISTIQNEIILFCALAGIKDSFDIYNFIKYFKDYGMEAELQLIKNRISETQ